jgi:DNA/RNA-binding domain of Phe-tRNA-synthetase-like protein
MSGSERPMMEIRVELRGVKLGAVEARGVHVTPVEESLAKEMDAVCERLRQIHTVESLPEFEPVRRVRAMFRAWGMDPSKYRPSSEALLRRVAQGKGLYRISNGVDAANLGSIETGWPFGCYDLARISGPITLRLGASSEKYEGIGKKTWHLEDRPVLADDLGPFGSPISDSTHTMVTEQAQDLLAIIYAPEQTSAAALDDAMSRLAERFTRSAGAKTIITQIIPAAGDSV